MSDDRSAQQSRDARLLGKLAEAAFTFGFWIALFPTFLILLLMVAWWLKFGEWPRWTPVELGVTPPKTSLIGLNKILQWLLDHQAPWYPIVAGGALVVLGVWLGRVSVRKVYP
jgi:hypothetical protein